MLCDICDSLKLSPENFIIRPNDHSATFDQRHDLGSLRVIRQKSNYCPLCRLVVEAVGGITSEPGQQEIDIRCELFWQEDGFIRGEEGPAIRSLKIRARPWPPAFNEYNQLALLADDVPTGQQLFFGRQIVQAQIDIKLVKKWIRLCQRWHGEDCQQPSTGIDWQLSSNFKVLDTWARCVVKAPPDCRYLALSYVWGTANVFKLLTRNHDELQTAGALNKVWQDLPNTIQDAITLASSLSFQYIWIDSLCILQNSVADKSSLIPYMHLIYDRAFMTIVAGTGKGAEAGLPGLRKYSRAHVQQVEEILPGLRLHCRKHVVDALDQSIYESRAWTYQEKCLSRRCLIFINGQMMFQCRTELWREDAFLEHVDVNISSDMTVKHAISGRSATGNPHSDYAGALYEYSSRQLSYDSDVLNAFAGISGILTERMNNARPQSPPLSHVYGLPTRYFGWAMLWHPNQTARRRSGGWPSWSWCGWVGTMAMHHGSLSTSELEDWSRDHTWIRWIVYDLDGEPVMPQIPFASSHQRERGGGGLPAIDCPPTTPAPAAKVQAMIASHIPKHTGVPCAALLHFRTLSTHFRLEATDDLTRRDAEPADRSYKICNASGTTCGTVWLSTAWSHSPERAYEFIVLADAERIFVLRNDPTTPVDAVSTWAAYHVMMIEWVGNGDVAERVATGTVYREAVDAWAVGPGGTAWKEIWLR